MLISVEEPSLHRACSTHLNSVSTIMSHHSCGGMQLRLDMGYLMSGLTGTGNPGFKQSSRIQQRQLHQGC